MVIANRATEIAGVRFRRGTGVMFRHSTRLRKTDGLSVPFRTGIFVLALVVLGIPAALAQSPGTFAATGRMLTPRFGHTVTLLPDGRVLIAGGNISCTLGAPCIPAITAELYDPASGTCRAAGTMNTIHPVGGILLPDGKVLFADGYPGGARARIESYDPSSGEFKIVGASASFAVVSSMALLNDGTVFLTGNNSSVSGGEIYDPVAAASIPVTAWPASARYAAVLAVLPDNRLLLDSPAVLDLVTGVATNLGSWPFNDTPPVSLLVDGTALVTGGSTDFGNVNWAELFDPSGGLFRSAGNMSFIRDGHTSTLLPDGSVLIAGGATSYNATTRAYSVTDTAEIYDAATGTFVLTGSMTAPHLFHAAVVLQNGQVLVTGGQATSPPEGPVRYFEGTATAELYTPDTPVAAPVLFSDSGDGRGQGLIWHSDSGEIASAVSPAVAGESLSMNATSLAPDGVIPPRVSIGGRFGEILYLGEAPGHPGYYQVDFRVPNGLTPGPAVPVHLTYLGRPSNEVTIAVR
jgi:uncharacterized protein (TIGR03437 family)